MTRVICDMSMSLDTAILQDMIDRTGAVVMGRTSFDKNEGDGGWGDDGPIPGKPTFVVTHHAPTTSFPAVFTFVTDGVALRLNCDGER